MRNEKDSSESTAYRHGIVDGYFGNPPEYVFLNVPRDGLERERWLAGHSDGEAVRRLDEERLDKGNGELIGYRYVRALARSIGRRAEGLLDVPLTADDVPAITWPRDEQGR